MNKELPLSLAVAKSVEKRYRPGMMKWHYEHGLVLLASLRAAEHYGDESVYPWVYSMYDPLIGPDGTIKTYREGEYNLDQINAGRNLFKLADKSGEERFLKATDRLHSQLEHQPRCKNGVFWHKEIYPWQIWLDGLYMEGPFNAEYAMRHGNREEQDDLAKQLITVYKVMKDPVTGLLYHCYDESRGMKWSDDVTGLSPHFWSRSIGWYLMAVLEDLEFLPEDHPAIPEILEGFKALCAALLPFQSEKGMWYQVTDQGSREGNYLETSGTSMFAFAYLKGSRLGILPPEFREKGLKAVEGIKEKYLTFDGEQYHLGGICSVAGLGGNPYRDGSFRYYISEKIKLDDFKGVGPFILAELEAEL